MILPSLFTHEKSLSNFFRSRVNRTSHAFLDGRDMVFGGRSIANNRRYGAGGKTHTHTMISQEIPKNNTQAKKTWLVSECVNHIVTTCKNAKMDAETMKENGDLTDWSMVVNWYALNTTYSPEYVKKNHLPLIKARLVQIRF